MAVSRKKNHQLKALLSLHKAWNSLGYQREYYSFMFKFYINFIRVKSSFTKLMHTK